MTQIRGIDISHHQPQPDWPRVAGDGAEFCICKASEGRTYQDDRFDGYYTGARDQGLIPGAYHFFRWDSSGKEQAANFLDAVSRVHRPNDPALFALDMEWVGGAVPTRLERYVHDALTWLQAVERATGRRPLIYTSHAFWQAIGDPRGFEQYPLWVAHYTRASQPRIPPTWDAWTIWQYLGDVRGFVGSIDGIAGAVDINRFDGTRADLEFLADGKVDVPQPPPKDRIRAALAEIEAAVADL